MNWYDQLSMAVGNFVLLGVLSIGLTCLFVWLAVKSPLFLCVIKIGFLVMWALMTVGVTLFAIVAIHIPKASYGAAFFTFIVGGIVSIPWVVVGLPDIIKTVKKTRENMILWE